MSSVTLSIWWLLLGLALVVVVFCGCLFVFGFVHRILGAHAQREIVNNLRFEQNEEIGSVANGTQPSSNSNHITFSSDWSASQPPPPGQTYTTTTTITKTVQAVRNDNVNGAQNYHITFDASLGNGPDSSETMDKETNWMPGSKSIDMTECKSHLDPQAGGTRRGARGSRRGGSARGGSNSSRGGSARGGSARGGSARGGSARGGSARGGSARGGSARRGSERRGSERRGSERRGSTRHSRAAGSRPAGSGTRTGVSLKTSGSQIDTSGVAGTMSSEAGTGVRVSRQDPKGGKEKSKKVTRKATQKNGNVRGVNKGAKKSTKKILSNQKKKHAVDPIEEMKRQESEESLANDKRKYSKKKKNFKLQKEEKLINNPLVVFLPICDYREADDYDDLKCGKKIDGENVDVTFNYAMGYGKCMQPYEELSDAFKLKRLMPDTVGIVEDSVKKKLREKKKGKQYDSLIFVYSGHGCTTANDSFTDYREQAIVLSDGFELSVSTLLSWFKDTKDFTCLEGCPRIFIFASCQGETNFHSPKYRFYLAKTLKREQKQSTGKYTGDELKRIKLTEDEKLAIFNKFNPNGSRLRPEMTPQERTNRVRNDNRAIRLDPGFSKQTEQMNEIESDPLFYVINASETDFTATSVQMGTDWGNALIVGCRNAALKHFSKNGVGSITWKKLCILVHKRVEMITGQFRQHTSAIGSTKYEIRFVQQPHAKIKTISANNPNYKKLSYSKLTPQLADEKMFKVLNDNFSDGSESGHKMRNPLVCLLMIGDYHDGQNLNVKADYAKCIECFHDKFGYDVFYAISTTEPGSNGPEQAEVKESEDSNQTTARACIQSETILLKGNDPTPDATDRKRSYKVKWAEQEIQNFIYIECPYVIMNASAKDKYDGYILLFRARGLFKSTAIARSNFYDSFGNSFDLRNFRKATNTTIYFTDLQNCSKILFYDLDWQQEMMVVNEEQQAHYFQDYDHKEFRYTECDPHPASRYITDKNHNYFEYFGRFDYGKGTALDHSSKFIDTLTKKLPSDECVEGSVHVGDVLDNFATLMQLQWEADAMNRKQVVTAKTTTSSYIVWDSTWFYPKNVKK